MFPAFLDLSRARLHRDFCDCNVAENGDSACHLHQEFTRSMLLAKLSDGLNETLLALKAIVSR